MYAYVLRCMCTYTYIHIHIYVYTYAYIYMDMCMCICALTKSNTYVMAAGEIANVGGVGYLITFVHTNMHTNVRMYIQT